MSQFTSEPLCTLSPTDLLSVKNYYHKLQRSLEQEIQAASGPTRYERIATLLRRVEHRLKAIYAEFERRTREKAWPPAKEAYGTLDTFA